jgi:hypothetical protein
MDEDNKDKADPHLIVLAAFLLLVVAVTYFVEQSNDSSSYKETHAPTALMAPPT